MIQTLEIFSKASNNEDASLSRPIKKLRLTPDAASCSDTDESSYCNDDDDTFVSAISNYPNTFAALDVPFEIGVVISPMKKTSSIASRRIRHRSSCTSTSSVSDLANNDLARQIEAMVLDAETAYKNRHLKKENHNAVRNEYSIIIPTKNPIQVKTSTPANDTCIPSEKNILGLLYKKPEKQHEYDDLPAMKPCDSLASMSSNSLISTRSSSGFEGFFSIPKRTMAMPSQHNAEWAIIE